MLGALLLRRVLAAGVAIAATLVLVPSAAAQPAPTAPRIAAVDFAEPPVVGRQSQLVVRAVDPGAPVSGIVVEFGDGEGAWASSACRPADSAGRGPASPFKAGKPVRFRVPHTFARRGARQIAIKLDAGGCAGGGGTTIQTATVTPTRADEPPVPIVLGPVVEVPRTPGVPRAEVPDVDVPGLPDLPGVPQLPLPDPPYVDGLPPLRVSASRVDAAASAGGCPNADRKPTSATLALVRRATICLINAERNSRGMRALRSNSRLAKAASSHSGAMVRRGFFSHVQPGGVDLITRLKRVGYITSSHTWRVGENIGAGAGRDSTASAIVRAWMASTPHRANILNPSFRELGLGLVLGVPRASKNRGGTYTNEFGLRR